MLGRSKTSPNLRIVNTLHGAIKRLLKDFTLLRGLPIPVPVYYIGESRISGKGVHMCKGVGVCFADFISFFLNIP